MRTLAKIALLTCGVFLALMLSTGVALATTYAVSGTVTVSVHEKGPGGVHFTIPLPASLMETGIDIAYHQIRRHDRTSLDEVRTQLAPYREGIVSLIDELESASPDYEMVRIESAEETVLVTKRGRNLVVDIDTEDATIHVSAPLGLVRQALRTFSA